MKICKIILCCTILSMVMSGSVFARQVKDIYSNSNQEYKPYSTPAASIQNKEALLKKYYPKQTVTMTTTDTKTGKTTTKPVSTKSISYEEFKGKSLTKTEPKQTVTMTTTDTKTGKTTTKPVSTKSISYEEFKGKSLTKTEPKKIQMTVTKIK